MVYGYRGKDTSAWNQALSRTWTGTPVGFIGKELAEGLGMLLRGNIHGAVTELTS